MCFSSICIDNFKERFRGGISILEDGFSLLSLFAIIFGSVVALSTYYQSVKSTALAGHINHLELFQSYVEKESAKFGIDSVKSIDTFFWYRKMFPKSRLGDTKFSKDYINLVAAIKCEIELSDRAFSQKEKSIKYTFTHPDHQRRVIAALQKIGISITRLSPNEFFEIESAALRLLDSVNLTFESGFSRNSPPLLYSKRAYS